jgi:triacylglycerol lipase
MLIVGFNIISKASNKIYFLHGYGGPGFEMNRILKAVEKSGFDCSLFKYRSLVKDIDLVGLDLIKQIQLDGADSISFVTHSMGALVVRSIYNYIDSLDSFPIINRIVMIAPPNNGTQVADFYYKFSFLRHVLGPNLRNLTTDSIYGARRYPIPTCEVGLITGSFVGSKTLNLFLEEENDGLVVPAQAKLGIEKDTVLIRSWHFGILFKKKVASHVISFLEYGSFTPTK